jgi:protein-tyrosine phosphatase
MSSNLPDKMIDYLYLGDQTHAKSSKVMKELNIKAIVNVTSSQFLNDYSFEIVHKFIPISDSSTSTLSEYFEETFDFIDGYLKEKQTILVHWFSIF